MSRQKANRESQRQAPAQRLQRQARTIDRFFYDKSQQPEKTSYEWKRVTYLGKEDRRHQIGLTENHWRPVPASRHPELSDAGGDKAIIVDGLMLMERPAYLTEEAHQEDTQNAFKQHGDQMKRLEQDIGLGSGMKQTPTQVNREYERTEVPADD